VIGGNVSITGTAVTSVSPGLVVDFGTGTTPADLPLIVNGSLTIKASGTGAANIDLNDLRVAKATTISLGSTANDTFDVQGTSSVTAQFAAFTLTSSSPASSTNTFSIQDQAGTLQFGGNVSLSLGSGNDTLKLGADLGNPPPPGFPGAEVEFFGKATFNGGAGSNTRFGGTISLNLFFAFPPKFSNI
jgi:hypothetical protein